MKAKLTFDLNDPDDKMSHLRCIKSTDMALALFEIVYNLKRDTEDGEDIFDRISDILAQNNVEIDELIS